MDPTAVYDNSDAPTATMRKRKRPYGEYVDEDTGEVTIVQTTKQVKRNYQKSGKWYREPTETELRTWERDEKRQATVDKAARREENKKVNAVKRAEKEEKEQELKRQQFEAGRITFTQTLAKKDEDQLNLHSWFGGRPKASKQQVRPRLIDPRAADVNAGNNKETRTQNTTERTADVDVQVGEPKRTFEPRKRNADSEEAADSSGSAASSAEIGRVIAPTDSKSPTENMDPQFDLDVYESTQEFDIAEDSDAETEILEQPEPVFKVPALPRRLPLSPMSKSDVNVRASQTSQINSFKDKLEKVSITMPSSTQAVRDLLTDLCTQDLADDMDSNEDEALLENKENQSLDQDSRVKSGNSSETDDMSCKPGPAQSAPTAQMNVSFSSIADSCDYDTIFAELDDTKMEMEEEKSDDFDSGLEDADLLSFPTTQLLSSGRPRTSGSRTKQTPVAQIGPVSESFANTEAPPRPTRKPFGKNDSFASEGLSENDLDELYQEFEKSEHTSGRASATSSSLLASGSTASHLRTRSVLPWNRFMAEGVNQHQPSQNDELASSRDYD